MATYESIMLGLLDVNEGIDRLKATNARLLETLEEMLDAQVCGPDCVVCDNARAAIKAATEG